MTTVEPIRSIANLQKLEKYLASKSPRDLLLLTIGTNCGELVELGNHNDLMSIENGQYRSLYEMQFKKQEVNI